MAKRWIVAALVACCCLTQTMAARAQWGLAGLEADPHHDPNIGNAAAQICEGVPQIDFSAGYLFWWFRDPKLAVPIAAGSAAGTPELIGTDTITYDEPFSGAEIRARMWQDNTQTGSIEVGGFIFGRRTSTASAFASASQPTVLVPNGPAIALFPTLPGGMIASASSFLWGADANLLVNTMSPVDLIFGARYLDLQEDLDITIQNTVAGSGINNQNISEFHARNQFYGGQVGVRACFRYGLFTFGAEGMLAIGNNHESILVSGTTTTGLVTTPGATFANAGNSGRFTRDQFALLPVADVRVGVDIGAGAQIFVAYNFLYLNKALRPGNQVSTQFTNGQSAPIPLNETFFWAHGGTVGLELRY
jgi:hypothetical protein